MGLRFIEVRHCFVPSPFLMRMTDGFPRWAALEDVAIVGPVVVKQGLQVRGSESRTRFYESYVGSGPPVRLTRRCNEEWLDFALAKT